MRRLRQGAIEERFGEPIGDLLQRLYHVEKMGIKQVARHIGVSDRVIWEWFNDLNIPRRSRSDAVRLQWVNNEARRQATSQKMHELLDEWAPTADARKELSVRANLACRQASPTSIERYLMVGLDTAGIPYVFQFVVGNKFMCDFGFPDAMLIVECDGEYWHSTPTQRRRDASKDAYLQACGYTVVRFSDKQLQHDLPACIEAIKALVGSG